MKQLESKLVCITGASSGIGKATAIECAREGANLLLCARRLDVLETLAKEISQDFSVQVIPKVLDVQDTISIETFVDSLPAQWRKIDVLVNNAGLAIGRGPLESTKIEDIKTMINTNLNGLIYTTKAVLPGMIQRNEGHIVNIGSIAGHESYPGGTIYCATKSAVNAFTSALKKDLLGTAIRVSVISPGMVKTSFSEVRFKGDIKKADEVYQNMLPLEAQDIAQAVVFSITRPAHVNINEIVLMPTDQASVMMVSRKKG